MLEKMQETPSLYGSFLLDRVFFHLGGEDCFSFLQRLLPHDLRFLAQGFSLWTGVLTPQGKILYDMLLHSFQGAILLECSVRDSQEIHLLLQRYRLRSKVRWSLLPAGSVQAFAIWPAASSLSEEVWWKVFPSSQTFSLRREAGRVYHKGSLSFLWDPRLVEAGLRVVGPRALLESDLQTWLSSGYLRLVDSPGYYRRFRYLLGIAESSNEIEPRRFLPQEIGLIPHWDKGCFIGQEVVARVHYRGTLRKAIYPVTLEGSVDPKNLSLFHEGLLLGSLLVWEGGRGLAYLRKDRIEGVSCASLTPHTSAEILPRHLP